MKRNIQHFGCYREKAVGASLCNRNAEPILELRAENQVCLAGFSRHRDTVHNTHRERGCHPNLGGTTDYFYASSP